MASRNYSAEDAKRDVKAAAEETASELRDGARRIADQARKTLDDVSSADSIERVKEKGAEMASAAADASREYAAAARDTGREYADRARHEAERLYGEGKRKAGEVATYAEDYYDEVSDLVRRKPAQALGIAAGVGFLIGLILARR